MNPNQFNDQIEAWLNRVPHHDLINCNVTCDDPDRCATILCVRLPRYQTIVRRFVNLDDGYPVTRSEL